MQGRTATLSAALFQFCLTRTCTISNVRWVWSPYGAFRSTRPSATVRKWRFSAFHASDNSADRRCVTQEIAGSSPVASVPFPRILTRSSATPTGCERSRPGGTALDCRHRSCHDRFFRRQARHVSSFASVERQEGYSELLAAVVGEPGDHRPLGDYAEKTAVAGASAARYTATFDDHNARRLTPQTQPERHE
jgi:hypothetical protein